MTKRTEVKIIGNHGAYWAPGQVIGEEDGMLIVEYKDLLGAVHEAMVWPHAVRQVEADITDELLRDAALKAVQHIQQHVLALEDEVLEQAGLATLNALRLQFGYPS